MHPFKTKGYLRNQVREGIYISWAVPKDNKLRVRALPDRRQTSESKTHKRIKSLSNKKWFDEECRLKRHEWQKLANKKHRDPLNTTIREQYDHTLAQYKKILNSKKNDHYKCQDFWARKDCSQFQIDGRHQKRRGCSINLGRKLATIFPQSSFKWTS